MGYRRRVNSSVGQRITRIRLLRGLKVNELDRLACVAPGTTSRIERGERGGKGGHRAETLRRYAKALRVRLDYLLTETGPMDLEDDPLPHRARTVELVRREGKHSEDAIAHALGLPADPSKSPLFWYDVIRAKDELLKLEASLAPPSPPRKQS